MSTCEERRYEPARVSTYKKAPTAGNSTCYAEQRVEAISLRAGIMRASSQERVRLRVFTIRNSGDECQGKRTDQFDNRRISNDTDRHTPKGDHRAATRGL